METASARAAAFWTALLLLILLVLSQLVVRQRFKARVSVGDGGVEPLFLASRAFGNCAEYAGPGIGALAVLALVQASPWAIHAVGGLLTLGRVIHAVALSLTTKPNRFRAAGMVMTWLALIFAIVTLLFYAIG